MTRRSLIDRAWEMLAARDINGHRPPRGLAMPFGIPEPDPWQWRMSGDTELQGLQLLFGIPVVFDDSLPPNSLILELRGQGG